MPKLKTFNRKHRSNNDSEAVRNFSYFTNKSKASANKILDKNPSFIDDDSEGDLYHYVCL